MWPLNVELVALALRCDLVRFGSLTCTAAGDRYNLYDLPTMVHDLAHAWRPDFESQFIRSVKWIMGNLALLLAALDDPAHRDPDGATVLDRTTILIGTEVGNPAVHAFEDQTYMIAGGPAFRAGTFDFHNRATDVDLYATVARALGRPDHLGDSPHFHGFLDGLV